MFQCLSLLLGMQYICLGGCQVDPWFRHNTVSICSLKSHQRSVLTGKGELCIRGMPNHLRYPCDSDLDCTSEDFLCFRYPGLICLECYVCPSTVLFVLFVVLLRELDAWGSYHWQWKLKPELSAKPLCRGRTDVCTGADRECRSLSSTSLNSGSHTLSLCLKGNGRALPPGDVGSWRQ